MTLGFRLTAELRPGSQSIPIDSTLGLQELAAANARKAKDWEVLLLLADEPCVTAAREWRDAVREFERFSRQRAMDETAWQERVDLMNEARDSFYVAARRSLGVHSGSVGQFK